MQGSNSSNHFGTIRRLAAVSLIVGGIALPACPDSASRPMDQATTTPPQEVIVDHDSVVRVDPVSGRVQAVVPVGPDPLLMDVASGHVWTLNLGDGTLSLIDPATNRATTLSIGVVVGMTADGDDLWVAVDGNTLAMLDGATGDERASIRLGARPLFALRDAGFLAVGIGAIWLTVPELGRGAAPQMLWRIEPTSGHVTAKIRLGPNPLSPLSDGRYLWIITMTPLRGELTRIDMRSNEVTQVRVGDQPWGLAVGAGSLWVGHQSDLQVWRLDRRTGETTAKVPIGDAARGIGFGDGLVWVTTETGLTSIDPVTDEVIRTIELIERTPDEGPTDVAYVAGSIWVSVE